MKDDAATADNILGELRLALNKCDDALLQALKQRFELVHEIGKVKSEKNISVLQPARIDVVVNRARSFGRENGINEEFLESLYRSIIAEAMRIEHEK